MFGFGKRDAAEHAFDTLSDHQWSSLTSRAAWIVLQTLRADGVEPIDPIRVTEIAAGVLMGFCEGHQRIEVLQGVDGDDLVREILRGVGPLLQAQARGQT